MRLFCGVISREGVAGVPRGDGARCAETAILCASGRASGPRPLRHRTAVDSSVGDQPISFPLKSDVPMVLRIPDEVEGEVQGFPMVRGHGRRPACV